MKKRKKLFIIILFLLIFLILFIFSSMKYDFLQEDLIFFQFFNTVNQSADRSQFIFDVQYKNLKLKDINLLQTVNNKTLVYEKIAPGTSGGFDILISSQEKMNYKITFESENVKPSNLKFYTSEDNRKYDSLEELGNTLEGIILENEEKKIYINWEWPYEINKQSNEKDTIDANRIRKYNFSICVKGY